MVPFAPSFCGVGCAFSTSVVASIIVASVSPAEASLLGSTAGESLGGGAVSAIVSKEILE